VRTFSPKSSDIQRAWLVVDAEGLTLGRLATEVARRLRGKHKTIFAPNVDTGDFVIVINADKVYMDSGKAQRTFYHHYSGFPGGMKTASIAERLVTKPEAVVTEAVKGMLPKNSLGRAQLKKLKVYAGSSHPHEAQSPTVLVLPDAKRS
jgi:large subunit ribosomal protein L13